MCFRSSSVEMIVLAASSRGGCCGHDVCFLFFFFFSFSLCTGTQELREKGGNRTAAEGLR